MNVRLTSIFAIMFFVFGAVVHAQDLTGDDLIQKIKSIVDIDFEQEDQLIPIMGDYADSINKINDLIQKNVDQEVIAQKVVKLNDALELKLKNVFTTDQMHEWDAEKKDFYKEILIPANSQTQ